MEISVGTFNIKNLFSRFNFAADISTLTPGEDAGGSSSIKYKVGDDAIYRLRKYMGKLVNGKSRKEREVVAGRIKSMDLDVLALQEVEDIDVLKTFNHDLLGKLYPHHVLVEGNDKRLIDVALYSKYPLRSVTSWHQHHHPQGARRPIFSRDLLQVEVMDKSRKKVLFTVFNTHLKSHYGDEKGASERRKNNDRRKKQAEAIHKIVSKEMDKDARYLIVGDMNDPVGSRYLAPFTQSSLKLVNGLANPLETRPAKPERIESNNPNTTAWTHRYGAGNYELYDQIWLSRGLGGKLKSAHIDRRTKHGGDGSDHDPAWVVLKL